jgi:hypothetical protein
MSEKYTYEASNAGDGTWMVRRKKTDGNWDEALLRDVPITADEKQVIQMAIERGSWA